MQEHQGEAFFVRVGCGRSDSVKRRWPESIGPPHQEIANVDCKEVFHRLDLSPIPSRRFDLKPSHFMINLDKREHTVVGVWTGP